jgi:hypothetical protein
MSENGKNPLHRWSERKARARRQEKSLETVAEEAPAELTVAVDEEGEVEAEAEVAVDLPDIESLDKDSDYSVFMGKGVPEHLKRLALRKLWRSDPLLAGVDGLVDYGEDFTRSELMGDAVKTIYRVGKGLIDDAEKLAEIDDAEKLAEEEELGDGVDGGEDEDEVAGAQPTPKNDNGGEPVDEG